MLKRLLLYCFPLFLVAIEWIMRKAMGIDTETFMGPTLAAVGLSFLIGLIVPKNKDSLLSSHTLDELEQKGIKAVSKREQNFIYIVFIFVLVLIASWAFSLYFSSASPNTVWIYFSAYNTLGWANYLVGAVFTEIKEAV